MMFSVIIPVYNAEKYLRPCLDSVLAQTDQDWECVCVDDGSTDGSAGILDDYAARDSRFQVLHQVNGGEGVARNTGLAHAHGDWITWLDADDLYTSDRLAEARRIIGEYNPDLVRFRTYMGRPEEDTWGPARVVRKDCRVYEGDDAKCWGWDVLMPVGMVWTWVAKRGLLAGVPFRSGMRVKVDGIYCGYLANRFSRVVQSECQTYFYRYVQTSAIHAVRRAEDCLRLLAAVRDLYDSICWDGLSENVVISAQRRLRTHCECDIVDWVLMRKGEKDRNAEIRAAYLGLEKDGVFDGVSILSKRYRIAFFLWRLTGWSGGIAFMGGLVRLIRRIRHRQ